MQAASRSLPPKAPLLGVFPLDHGGVCKARMRAFIACLEPAGATHATCRGESREYLRCRMDNGLMVADEGLLDLIAGTGGPAAATPGGSDGAAGGGAPVDGEIIAGLSAARRAASGGLGSFGIGGQRKGH